MIRIFTFIFLLIFSQSEAVDFKMCDQFSPLDPSSYSRPDLAEVTNIHLELNVDFKQTIVSGFVDLTVEKKCSAAKEVILDTHDLTIESVRETTLNIILPFNLSEPYKTFGSKLTIALPESTSNVYHIRIHYQTSNNATGLQWLEPEQTSGKKYSYMFSQFEPIACRSFVPLQDTPGVKCKYTAVITAPSEYTVLMSALSTDQWSPKPGLTEYSFRQDVPIPSYLIAIVVGVLKSRDISPRIRVWSEENLVDAGYEEFLDTETKLKTAEAICGPYIWGRYDLLILPPSFPFGGMENPCLTFITPTLLAGDGSLTNVVAHEIAHSWTGNLVTNKNFEHFWLNEGFTVYIERRIIAHLEGEQAQDLLALGGLEELKETVKRIGVDANLTKLVPSLIDVHPDDAFSQVPYEKGSLFLRYLAKIVGGQDKFDAFLKSYFDRFKFQSIVTDDFKKYFLSYFKNCCSVSSIDWNTWLHTPGLPNYDPVYDRTHEKGCQDIKKKILNNTPISEDEVKKLSSTQKIHTLQLLINECPLSLEQIKVLEKYFNADKTKNAEIKFRFLRICLRSEREDIVDKALEFVTEVGRMKYVRPIYRDLYNFAAARDKAIETFKRNKKSMMHVSAYVVEQDLKL